MGASYLTDLTFDDGDAQRVTKLSNVGGPTVLAQTAAAGSGVALTTGTATSYTLTISVDDAEVDIYALFVATYGAPPADVDLTVIVNAGVIIHANSNATAAVTWSSLWTGAPTFALENNGYIIGYGGTGGNAGDAQTITIPTDGDDGGPALELNGQTVDITNGSGSIWGGGGGAGAGGWYTLDDGTSIAYLNSGGGGPGAGSITGLGANTGNSVGVSWANGGDASSGADNSAYNVYDGFGGGVISAGSVTSTSIFLTGVADTGGNGGNYGDVGLDGQVGLIDGGITIIGSSFPSAGGLGGNAINLTGGTANFISGGGFPNVKGTIS